MYTIIDIETTGNGIKGNKITEISIFKYDGNDLVEEYTSLVNPECEISYFITSLTGIDNTMVRNAPTIKEIASKIIEITKDTIFVAHSVGFDYNVIKNELENIGIPFSRKKLCTVRLSRKLIPGLKSYSLGKLCTALEIPLNNRHRARGDAQATLLLFKKLLNAKNATHVFNSFLNSRSQENTLPPALPKEEFNKLPNKAGIYYFKNEKNISIYIGKAINIKKRVLSHFYNKTTKEIEMCSKTAHLDFKPSGNELIALLMESAAIKKEMPNYNRAQKRTALQYGIFSYEDRNGILHIAYNKIKSAPNAVQHFFSVTDCRLALEKICEGYNLCPKYCHLQENITHCSHYKIKKCNGICKQQETTVQYNERVKLALRDLKTSNDSYFIKEQGRTKDEIGIVAVLEGQYKGYAFIPIEEQINNIEELESFIIPQKNNLDALKIIESYTYKKPHNVIYLSPKEEHI
ncbi:exonuclease domain-containing protein [uncultured Maribacter sp.]|uniref:exonuclease domain-containing protein n=1 Tax=uncultured Maribacter sp. TaxID=431308 RepID=UPI00260303E6|nr:exonuclease domain-containing protein [uncultured Maribacter sp.]